MSRHVVLTVDRRAVRGTDVDRVAEVLAGQPASRTVERLADVFSLLGEPSRLRLLTALRVADELCVADLALVSGLSESATSHALRLLRAHGVVEHRRAGRRVLYSLGDEHVRLLLETALDHAAHEHG